ncbi:hypothetical protein G3580_12295 [Nitrogeniibacter mangrovi]|uniref:Uncharacterized protein n=1 Tax=Nitrogeniibacter mangrovi TaxID=2016596 RepID=A0A6C1B4D0_9RHOO|nr:hypothetical protein [Nitrogeniibacter mangrovi]QID18347.1 hypothetical protein G3580_12295 [Nitrogeniibacter mangrovi]
MKLFETDFFLQWISVVTMCLLVVGTAAFISIPASLSHHPGEALASAHTAMTRHLT